MFGHSNLQSQIEYLQRELLRHRELIHDLQTTVYKLVRKKETEEPKNGVGFYEALSVCCDFPQPARWTVLADKCEKLQEENNKLKVELAEAHLKNDSLNSSFSHIAAERRRAEAECDALRERNKKLLNTVKYLDGRLDKLIMAGILDKDGR